MDDLSIWEQRKVKDSKTGPKAYTYFMATWRERKDKERLPRTLPEDKQRAGSGAGKGYEKGGLRARALNAWSRYLEYLGIDLSF